ncbi:MAG TPA: hypothetical protein VIV11_42260 [Kofleriaceae bacterium]
MAVNIFCPVCLRWDQVAVGAATRTGRCECGVTLLLDGNVVPAELTRGYPDKLLTLTATSASPLKTWKRGDEVWFRPRGSLIAKAVIITPERFEQRTRIGTRSVEPIAHMRGFLPIQQIQWLDNEPTYTTWQCYALLDGAIAPLYPFKQLDEAVAAAQALTQTLLGFKDIGDPFRS